MNSCKRVVVVGGGRKGNPVVQRWLGKRVGYGYGPVIQWPCNSQYFSVDTLHTPTIVLTFDSRYFRMPWTLLLFRGFEMCCSCRRRALNQGFRNKCVMFRCGEMLGDFFNVSWEMSLLRETSGSLSAVAAGFGAEGHGRRHHRW